MTQTEIFDRIKQERICQEHFLEKNIIPYSAASSVPDFNKLSILMEEVGEIAKNLNDRHKGEEYLINLKLELIQTAAVCVAWLESL